MLSLSNKNVAQFVYMRKMVVDGEEGPSPIRLHSLVPLM
jgi:hypothetical protein